MQNRGFICKRAFSLIELMVVIAIIGILSSIAMVSYRAYVKRSNAMALINIIPAVKNIYAEFYATYGLQTASNQSVLANKLANISSDVITSVTLGAARTYGSYFRINSTPALLGYDPSDCGDSSTICKIYVAFKPDASNIIAMKCGYAQAGQAQEIRHEFLPSSCKSYGVDLPWLETAP